MNGSPDQQLATAPLCIAVFEDNPAIQRGMQLLLSVRGCEVVLHDHTEDALAFVRRHRPAVVVVDLHFEGRAAGLEIVRQLRAAADTAQLPIIVWSTDLDAGRRVEDAGLDGIMVLSKYGHASVLLAKLNDLATARTAGDELGLPEAAGSSEN